MPENTSDTPVGAGPVVHRHGPLPASRAGAGSRFLNRPESGAWTEPVLAQWELTGSGWEDCHPHSETNVVLEGTLHVECDGVEVVLGPGDVVHVPAGTPGRYWAPGYARMVSIYGPNPDGAPTPPGRSWWV
jgi:uncharacterized cupin superfamily protein